MTRKNVFYAVPYNFVIENHIARFQGNCFKLPCFQRGFVWTKEQALLFIDSIQSGYPLSCLTFAQLKRDSVDMYLLDGQQRVLSIVFLKYDVFPTDEGRIKVNEWFKTNPEWSSLVAMFGDKTLFEKLGCEFSDDLWWDALPSIELKPCKNIHFDEYWMHIKECFKRLNLGGTSMSDEEIEMLLKQN